MIKQRNPNTINNHKQSLLFPQKKQSPFNRSNPYRVKAQFYSQKKKVPQKHIDRNSREKKDSQYSNPQSLKYTRNYKQNPPLFFQFRHFKDNFMSVKNNMLERNLRQGQFQEQEYKIKMKQFILNKFCPSDPYLQIVRDKFAYLGNGYSEFKNVMRMGSLSTKDKSNLVGSVSYKDKLNPFYRKSLISSANQNELIYDSKHGNNKWEYFSSIGQKNTQSSYHQSSYYYKPLYVHNEHLYSSVYEVSVPPLDPKVSMQKKGSSYSSSKYNNNGQRYEQNGGNRQNQTPKSSLAASFGPEYDWKIKNQIGPFIDTVIEKHVEDPLNIQSSAPKTISINGKTFYLNHMKRLKA